MGSIPNGSAPLQACARLIFFSRFRAALGRRKFGIMFAMTLSPISNIEEDWREEDDGLIPAHSFGIQSRLSKGRFKLIRHHFATGAVGG